MLSQRVAAGDILRIGDDPHKFVAKSIETENGEIVAVRIRLATKSDLSKHEVKQEWLKRINVRLAQIYP